MPQTDPKRNHFVHIRIRIPCKSLWIVSLSVNQSADIVEPSMIQDIFSRVDSLRFHIDPEPSFRILWMGKLKQQIIANLTVRYFEVLYILADHFIRCWIRIQPIINLVLSI